MKESMEVKATNGTLTNAPRATMHVESSGQSNLCLFQSKYEKTSPFPRTCKALGAFLAHW